MLPTLVTWTTHFIDAGTLQFSPSTARHVQLVTELYLYRLHIFNQIEVSRLDSTLSLFVIIHTYILYHGVRLVVRIQTAFKTIQTGL